MVELPKGLRTTLVQALDEYFEDLDDTSDRAAVTEFIIESIELAAEETDSVDGDILGQLQESTESDVSLVEQIEESLNKLNEFTGEEIVELLEQLCEIEWLGSDDDGDELTAGFFGEGTDYDLDD